MLQVFYDDVHLLRVVSISKDIETLHKENNFLEYLDTKMINGFYEVTFKTEALEVNQDILFKDKAYPVIFRGVVKKDWFLEKFDATEEKMGAWVKDDKTHFSVYAPTATSMRLLLEDEAYDMTRESTGTFKLTIDKNCHGKSYLYEVNIYHKTKTTTDPYAIASLPNRKASVVVDVESLNLNITPLIKKDDPIILEASVRDFSMDPKVKFKNRGQFLGMLESHGNYGMAHVLDLGITHLQLMPVNDFETVDELNPLDKYNWGYDTMQFMSLEGSYSSNVHDPIQVMHDFAKLVDGYHKEGVGINLDVVFNHIYEVEDHPLNVLVPYYYFRYTQDFSLSNGSFCGNEIASEMPMCRKLIIESTTHFVDTYKVDGYRFDLMGLLDVDTMNGVFEACHELNPNIMIYGEGWSMPTVLPEYMQASMKNYFQMPRIGHFNDQFRDNVAGELNKKDLGYAGGDVSLTESIKAAISGSSDHTYGHQMFQKTSQSVNYVECHDNMTIADKVTLAGKGKDEALFMMGLVILSQGIPFLQIGQSFFRNKQGDENSYKSSDSINRINWSYLDKNKAMNDQVKAWIKIRKEMYRIKEGYSFRQERALLHYYYGPYQITFNPNGIKDKIEPKEISIKKHPE